HVGIYADNDSFIHASTSSGVVKSSMNNQYWRQVYWQSRRL
ncbi:MAG: NlpC/P60 family protein, partial [Plesiomonas sp.]